jgi:hypothetical protein
VSEWLCWVYMPGKWPQTPLFCDFTFVRGPPGASPSGSESEPCAPPPPLPPYSHPARSSVTRGRPCVQAEGWERQVGLVGLTVARGWVMSWQCEDWV